MRRPSIGNVQSAVATSERQTPIASSRGKLWVQSSVQNRRHIADLRTGALVNHDFAQIYTEFIDRVQAVQHTIRQNQMEGIVNLDELRDCGIAISNTLPPDFENQELATERMLVTSGLAAIPSVASMDSIGDISTPEALPESVAQYWSTQVMEPIRSLLQAVRSTFNPEDDELDDFYTFARTQLAQASGGECSDERQAARIIVLVVAAAMPAEEG